MRVGSMAAIAAWLLAAAPAAAGTLTFTGTVDPYNDSVPIGFDGNGAGTYLIRYSFSEPATGSANFLYRESYNYIDENGEYIGGNDVDYFDMKEYVSERSGSLQVTIPKAYEEFDGIYTRRGFYVFEYAYLDFYAPVPGDRISYQITTTFAAQVPEPSTWILLIVGFGAIGGALRRRSAAPRALPA